jgi:hypothetical protein
MSKSEEKRIAEQEKAKEIEKMVVKDAVAPRKFRYYCDACTGIAFYSEEVLAGKQGNCQACGKPYVARKENFIKL